MKQRVRKKHSKVRSGCLTCKARRKKCDEGRPTCLRCIKAGKSCEGYATSSGIKFGIIINGGTRSMIVADTEVQSPEVVDQQAPHHYNEGIRSPFPGHSDQHENVAVGDDAAEDCVLAVKSHQSSRWAQLNVSLPHLGPIRSPKDFPNLPPLSDVQVHCLSFFRDRTLPQLASYFEGVVWHSKFVRIDLVLTHPALFLAVVALGAVHRRFSYGISPEAFEYCGHADTFYHQAIRALVHLKTSHWARSDVLSLPPSRIASYEENVIAVSEMVLGVFQSFQAEAEASETHIRNGLLHFIKCPLQLLHSESWQLSDPAKPRVLCRLMHQVYCRIIDLFGTPIEVRQSSSAPIYAPPAMPDKFNDLEEMRNRLFIELDWIWHAEGRAYQDSERREQVQEAHESRLSQWSNAYARAIENPEMTKHSWQRQALNLMHLARSTTSLIMHVNLFIEGRGRDAPMADVPVVKATYGQGSEAEFEKHIAELAEILWEAVIRTWREGSTYNLTATKQTIDELLDKQPVFSFEQLNNRQSATSTRCKSPDPVDTTPSTISRLDDAIDLVGIYSIAKHVSDSAEAATIHALQSVIPTEADMRFVDIACVSLENRKVLLRYYVPDDANGNQWWTQEWWTF